MLPSRKYFNPRSPHGERQLGRTCFSIQRSAFQSTLPARGATAHRRNRQDNRRISIHAPRTGSDGRTGVSCGYGNISIHAPRTGSDMQPIRRVLTFLNFNPRTPHGERLAVDGKKYATGEISIHAPRTGSDGLLSSAQRRASNFNPRSPHGERPALRILKRENASDFNPRSPHGERQKYSEILPKRKTKFQSTHPARGATRCAAAIQSAADFNPRSPHGERPRTAWRTPPRFLFQSTLPARGATILHELNHALRYFNPRSPHGERQPLQPHCGMQ